MRQDALLAFHLYGFEHDGFGIVVKDVNRQSSRMSSCTGGAAIGSMEMDIGIPQRFDRVDYIATIVHELGHALQKLEHRDMLSFQSLYNDVKRRLKHGKR